MAGSRWAACCRGTLTTVLSINQIVDAYGPYGPARSRRSPASTSTRTNAADGVGPRPSSSVEDTAVRAQAPNGVLPHQSERARRTSKEAYRSELIVATNTAPPSGSVWLQCAGAIRQRSASAHGLASDSARREQPPRGRLLKSPGYARHRAQCPAPGRRTTSTSRSSPPPFIQEDEPWIR